MIQSRLSSISPYTALRQKLCYDGRPVIRAAFDLTERAYGSGRFDSREPVIHHINDVADTLWHWEMSDEIIASGLCHRFRPEEILQIASPEEMNSLSSILPNIACFRTLRDFQPLEVQNLLSEPELIRSNYWKMTLKELLSSPGLSEQAALNALMIMAADQLCTINSALSGYWDFELERQAYTNIAMSTANLLRELNLSHQAGDMFDACLEILEPEIFQDISFSYFGTASMRKEMHIQKGRIQRLLESGIPKRYLKGRAESLKGIIPDFSVSSRVKTVSSVGKKMTDKGPENVKDILGFRVTVNMGDICDNIASLESLEEQRNLGTISDEALRKASSQYRTAKDAAYQVHAVIGAMAEELGWEEILGTFDNYLERPKPNGYQSLQRSFLCRVDDREIPIEIQTQTCGMHDWAVWGGAAHSGYKTGRVKSRDSAFARNITEKFAEIAQDLGKKSYGFSFGEKIKGPFEVEALANRELKEIDLAFAIDQQWALRGAQFWRRDSKACSEEECTPGTSLRNGDMLSVVTSSKVRPSEQRAELAGTLAARKALRAAIMTGELTDQKALREKGISIFEKLASEEALRIFQAASLTIKKNPRCLLLQPYCSEKLGLLDIEEIAEELATGRKGLGPDLMSSLVFVLENKSRNEICFGYRNPAFTKMLVNILLESGMEMSSLSIWNNREDMFIKISADHLSAKQAGMLFDKIRNAGSSLNAENRLEGRYVEVKATSLLPDSRAIGAAARVLYLEGADISDCRIEKKSDASGNNYVSVKAGLRIRGSAGKAKTSRITCALNEALQSRDAAVTLPKSHPFTKPGSHRL